MRDRSRKSRI